MFWDFSVNFRHESAQSVTKMTDWLLDELEEISRGWFTMGETISNLKEFRILTSMMIHSGNSVRQKYRLLFQIIPTHSPDISQVKITMAAISMEKWVESAPISVPWELYYSKVNFGILGRYKLIRWKVKPKFVLLSYWFLRSSWNSCVKLSKNNRNFFLNKNISPNSGNLYLSEFEKVLVVISKIHTYIWISLLCQGPSNPFLAGCEWWWQQSRHKVSFWTCTSNKNAVLTTRLKWKWKEEEDDVAASPFTPTRLPDHILFPSFVSFLIQQNQPFLLTWWCFIIH